MYKYVYVGFTNYLLIVFAAYLQNDNFAGVNVKVVVIIKVSGNDMTMIYHLLEISVTSLFITYIFLWESAFVTFGLVWKLNYVLVFAIILIISDDWEWYCSVLSLLKDKALVLNVIQISQTQAHSQI